MRKFFVFCFLFFGCSYSPTYSLTKDSYNTYAPVYAPTQTETYAPVNSTPAQTRQTYPIYARQAHPTYTRQVYPAYTGKIKKVLKYRPVIVRRIQ
jgi:hypothetical protein